MGRRLRLAVALTAVGLVAGACADTGTVTEAAPAVSTSTPTAPTQGAAAEIPATTEPMTTVTAEEPAGTVGAIAPTTTTPIPTTGPTTTKVAEGATGATPPAGLQQVSPGAGAFADAVMADVAAVDTGFVAVGTSHDTPTFWASEDGTAWTRHDGPGSATAAFAWGVTQGGPGLVAVGAEEDGIAAVWTSVDGVDWLRVPHLDSLEAAEMHAVTTFDDGLVAVGFGRVEREPMDERFAVVWNSTDGVNWVRVPDDEDVFGEGTSMWDVTSAGPGLVAVGGDVQASLVWTSRDGVIWERVSREIHQEPFLDDTFMYAVGGSQDLIVAGGYDMEGEGANMWTSPDGLTWSLLPRDSWGKFERSTITGVVPHDAGWVAVGNGLWTSPDGLNWNQEADQFALWPNEFTGAASFMGNVIIVGNNWETVSAAVWTLAW